MEILQKLIGKIEIHTTRISLLGVTYQEATQSAKTLEWLQFHINKTGGKTVDASFIVSKEESARVWTLLHGDTPDPLLA